MRLTVVYEFDYLVDQVTEEMATRLVHNFSVDPTGFLHPTELEVDEELIVQVEDITDGVE
jgi:hypothetical protein